MISYEVNHDSGAGQWPGVTTNYSHGEHLGSSRLMTNVDGYPVWQATYLPFGQEWNPQSTVNNYRFTGFERDTESDLDHTWFRQLSSSQARWLSPDPIGGSVGDPQSLNRYAYVLNNPLNLVDPLGLQVCQAPTCVVDELDTRSTLQILCQNSPGLCLSRRPGPGSPLGWEVDSTRIRRLLEQAARNAAETIGSLLKSTVSTACSAVPDAVTASGGVDAGLFLTGGVQAGTVANGTSGEFSLFGTGTVSFGLISFDAYVAGGAVHNAPTNSALKTPSHPTANDPSGYAVAERRTGVAISPNSYQVTLGTSVLPITAARQVSFTRVSPSIPYLGYALNWPRALCKVATGH